jgi:hypothetical protein
MPRSSSSDLPNALQFADAHHRRDGGAVAGHHDDSLVLNAGDNYPTGAALTVNRIFISGV